jgi:hydrogenase expression/formation protein HypD
VFFAVGFETTAPSTALAVLQASHLGLENFSLLVSHVRVQPAMEQLIINGDCIVDGFLAAGHVCTVVGYASYQPFVERYRRPVVVTGFEPVDLLNGILECVGQLERGEASLANRYRRVVSAEGNPHAIKIINDVYKVCDRNWRGLGQVRGGGLRLRSRWRKFDAYDRFAVSDLPIISANECRSGDVLAGRIKPHACDAFGTRCTPLTPLGAPMVSSEGACAAYFRYASRLTAASRTGGRDG